MSGPRPWLSIGIIRWALNLMMPGPCPRPLKSESLGTGPGDGAFSSSQVVFMCNLGQDSALSAEESKPQPVNKAWGDPR